MANPPTPIPVQIDLSDSFEMTISGEWRFTPNGSLEHKSKEVRICRDGTLDASQSKSPANSASDDEFRLTPLDIVLDADSGNLGRGAGGYVTSAAHRRFPDRRLAVKVVTIDDSDKRQQLYADLKTLMDLCPAPNLVHFYLAYVPRQEVRSVHMVLELMDLGSLQDLFNQLGKPRIRFPERYVLNVLRQVLTGAHRDIKPANILLNSSGEVKLTDFGITKNLGDTQGMCQSFVGTAMYMSPERIENDDYALPCDIWAVGMVAFEMAEGRFPLADDISKNVIKLYEALTTYEIAELPSGQHSEELITMVARCMQRQPTDRPLVIELLQDPIFTWYGRDDCRTASIEEFQLWLVQLVEESKNSRNVEPVNNANINPKEVQYDPYLEKDTSADDDGRRQRSNRSQASIEMI